MAVSSIKDFWIHPNALTITLNYFGDPQLIQTSMLAGAVIMAYRKDVISYDAAHNFREWKLQAFPTQLNDTCSYYVHAELSRGGDTAMIIYSPVKRDIEGRTLLRVEKDENGRDVEVWDNNLSTESYFIYLGTISASVNSDGATVERAWTDGFYTGTLDTDQQRMEDAAGEWKTMFNYNDVIGQIEPQKPFSKIKVMGEAIFQSIAQFVNGLVIGKRTITDVAASSDSGNESKVSDATLPTTGYVQKEIEALDDHFLIKDDPDNPQSVSGPVTFEKDVTVKGNQSVSGNQSIQGTQSVQGQATFHDGACGDGYVEQGDIIQGWNIDKDGIASFAKVKTPSMQVYELTLNRKTAVQGEFVFSDGEVVENVKFLGADTYLLTVRALYEGYITTFKVNDNLYSNINIIGSSAKTGKCWMYVTEVDGNKITAVHYPYEECPAGENINPVPYMTITRHGNRADKTRQDLFIISSETSSLTMLRGVSAPIVSSEGLYGVVLGRLPDTLLEYIHTAGFKYVNGEDPYVYARGVIVQDLIMLDYQGKPIVQERYRGEWRQEIANGLVQGEDTYQATASVADTVTYEGSLWRCMVTGTPVPPKDNIAEWQKKVSKGDDSTAVIYTLKPSSNIVYYRTASNTLSVDELTVKVSVAGNGEYYDIADQNTIEQAGLSVYYAIDGEGEPILLNISPDGEILLENGSGFIESEDGSDLLLEGKVLDITKIKDNITLYLKDIETGEMRASYVIPVIKDGEEGKQGRMLYPAGEWNEETSYAIENNSAPFVKEGSTYYVLVWEGSAVKGELPSTDKQGVYWRPFTYMNYLFAEFLMANWARLGGDNGAVFYDKWLFSQMLQNGEKYTNDIINENGNFVQGKYPKYAVNFLDGTSYMTNLIEPMNTSEEDKVIRINPNEGFNWFIPCNIDLGLYNKEKFTKSIPCSKPMVILPTLTELNTAGYSDWDINGAHITITFGTGGSEYAGLIGLTGGTNDYSGPTSKTYVANEFILVCVDDAILNTEQASGYNNLHTCNPEAHVLSYASHNFFICGGKRARYVMMAAGTTLKLRPVVINKINSNNRTIHWFVESDGVYSHPINIYSTAYVIPSMADTGYKSYKMRLHNHTDEPGYKIEQNGDIKTISVYASKEALADASIESNLTDMQEAAGKEPGCVFVCGEPALLPRNIIVSAQKSFETEGGTRTDRYHYRALFTESDGVGFDIINFSE